MQGLTEETVYTWDFGDGIVISGSGLESMATQTHSYHTTGRYTISVLASNPAGSSSINLEIFIGGLPVLKSLSVAGDVSEAGNTLNFTLVTDMTFATYYIWDFGDSSPIVRSEDHFNVEMQSKVYAGRGIYTVTVTAYNTYGINSTSMMVYVGVGTLVTNRTRLR
jgi:PKD repeat protein